EFAAEPIKSARPERIPVQNWLLSIGPGFPKEPSWVAATPDRRQKSPIFGKKFVHLSRPAGFETATPGLEREIRIAEPRRVQRLKAGAMPRCHACDDAERSERPHATRYST